MVDFQLHALCDASESATSPEGNSTSPVCHPSSGHKHVIHTLKTIVKHDSLFKL